MIRRLLDALLGRGEVDPLRFDPLPLGSRLTASPQVRPRCAVCDAPAHRDEVDRCHRHSEELIAAEARARRADRRRDAQRERQAPAVPKVRRMGAGR